MNDPINWIDPPGLLFGFNAGESYGESAAMYYAEITNDPCASWAAKAGAWAGGLFASLWTPGTSDATFMTLATGLGGRAAGSFMSGWRWLPNARGFEKAWSKDFRTGWHRLPPGNYSGAGRNLPHYHRRPGIGKHRPWQGGL